MLTSAFDIVYRRVVRRIRYSVEYIWRGNVCTYNKLEAYISTIVYKHNEVLALALSYHRSLYDGFVPLLSLFSLFSSLPVDLPLENNDPCSSPLFEEVQ